MTTIKNFIYLSIFIAVAGMFNINTATAQTSGDANQDMVVNFSDYSAWTVSRNLQKAGTGTLVLASNNNNRSQLMAELRDGKIVRVLLKESTGTLTLTPSSGAPCTTIKCFANQLSHCFQLPGGGCVCICGSWITMYPGN